MGILGAPRTEGMHSLAQSKKPSWGFSELRELKACTPWQSHMTTTVTSSPSTSQQMQLVTSCMSHMQSLPFCLRQLDEWSESCLALENTSTRRQAPLSSRQQAMMQPSSSPHDAWVPHHHHQHHHHHHHHHHREPDRLYKTPTRQIYKFDNGSWIKAPMHRHHQPTICHLGGRSCPPRTPRCDIGHDLRP